MSRPTRLGMLARPAASLLAAVHGLVVATLRRRVLGQLGQMDDRMLRDIGLTRQDLWSVTAEPLFRDPTIGLACRAGETRLAARAAARERAARGALMRLWAEDSRAA